MYFANWTGHSMVLPDNDAAEIYQTNRRRECRPGQSGEDTGTGVTGPAQNQLNDVYTASAINTPLRYGRHYDFRVRMRDLSGGGAKPDRVARSGKPIGDRALSFQTLRRAEPAAHRDLSDRTTTRRAIPIQLSIQRPIHQLSGRRLHRKIR